MSVRLALLTEIPAPYRIPLFNALAREPGIELRVLFLSARDPRREYRVYEREFAFDWQVLPGVELRRGGRWVVLNRRVLHELERFGPEVVVVGGWNQPASWLALLWTRARRRALVPWVESTARDARGGGRTGERAKRVFVAAGAAVLVPGRASADYVAELGADPTSVVVAPNAVDDAIFRDRTAAARARRAQLRDRLALTRCTFLYVGRLAPEKGVDVLVQAMRDVSADLIVVGYGAEEQGLRTLAPANVRFAGAVERDDLPDWYAASDGFVLPSRSETWGMVLNEAAAAELPLVVSDAAGGAYDLVEDGANGFRVPAEDVPALAAALRRLAEDAELRERAGARSGELSRRFTPEAWAAAVAQLARRLSAQRAALAVRRDHNGPCD